MNKKYILGMPIDQVKRIISTDYTTDFTKYEYPEFPSSKDYESTCEIIIQSKQEHVVLEFNHYEKLIAIKNIDVPVK